MSYRSKDDRIFSSFSCFLTSLSSLSSLSFLLLKRTRRRWPIMPLWFVFSPTTKSPHCEYVEGEFCVASSRRKKAYHCMDRESRWRWGSSERLPTRTIWIWKEFWGELYSPMYERDVVYDWILYNTYYLSYTSLQQRRIVLPGCKSKRPQLKHLSARGKQTLCITSGIISIILFCIYTLIHFSQLLCYSFRRRTLLLDRRRERWEGTLFPKWPSMEKGKWRWRSDGFGPSKFQLSAAMERNRTSISSATYFTQWGSNSSRHCRGYDHGLYKYSVILWFNQIASSHPTNNLCLILI